MSNPTLEQGIAEASGLTGGDLKLVSEIISAQINLWASNLPVIKQNVDEATQSITVGSAIRLDLSSKTPCGSAALSYSRKFKDEQAFRVEDADQARLNFEEPPRVVAGIEEQFARGTAKRKDK